MFAYGLMPFFNPGYLLFLAPAMLLAAWASWRVRSAYSEAQRMPASLTGAAAARHVLDSAGLTQIEIEQVAGQLTDHYDPAAKVLRLSTEVYQSRTLAAVGIAAHEAGHALQDAHAYAPMLMRNAAVPVANFGGSFSMVLFMLGMVMHMPFLLMAGILLFGGVVFFQLVNLPVEFDASNRAKHQLVALGIVDEQSMHYVRKVLDAAAWTYVAATLQSVMTLLYLLSRAGDRRG